MPAYIIVMREDSVRDQDALKQYQSLTRQMQTTIKPDPKVVYGNVEALEGDAPDGVVLLEFVSIQEARNWYNSGDYQKALPYRLQAAKHRAFIMEGL
ncbi:DUF1330 domain-containing protein [Ketobacter sp. MCCC 1A13808]|mgnify:CR=1 FL=1|uniref:DUF1330 domain-containing protein n=1 Tax=Ketobacter sp. MCCC 1A13808 TaxID=2602738 RepID=UPI0012EC25C7|nr:DUF1330 domain-containing protein [Ketobacter sp. MCCC 1A13808]MVF13475.1 DUF1330 domain-containing protein [Ketobacter sp. MCCC 1A13808]